ncbi:hypothetical protein Taro_023578 [Colocasia esculenta]|uniref:Calcineurin-like phosphoesterase domain-containing protein n=1 Tax=Colocasia esculenta TaxID=4460 RepID=A0A843V521_COLES|nr:hypothetical protein [Colocasia esculenta]
MTDGVRSDGIRTPLLTSLEKRQRRLVSSCPGHPLEGQVRRCRCGRRRGSMSRPWRILFFLLFALACLLLLEMVILSKLMAGNGGVPRVKTAAHLPLRFRPDGTFKILQVADMHYGEGWTTRCKDVLPSQFAGCSDLNTTRFLRRMIGAEEPDLIVFSGDNIFGPSTSDAAKSLSEAFGPAIESKLPWAAILGNHDQESTMSRAEVMTFISLMDYSVSEVNPPNLNGDHASIDGFGNYNLVVHGASGSELATSSVLNLYLLDSGDREISNGSQTSGWIKESQLRWLHKLSKGFQSSTTIQAPALAFFHIPIPEVKELRFKKIVGEFQQKVSCSSVNSGVLQTLVSMGDVKAVFMGHDHLNDFCGDISSILFCHGGGFGYHGYGNALWPRRARVVLSELEKDGDTWLGIKRIRTWKCLDDQVLTKIDEQVVWEQHQSGR